MNRAIHVYQDRRYDYVSKTNTAKYFIWKEAQKLGSSKYFLRSEEHMGSILMCSGLEIEVAFGWYSRPLALGHSRHCRIFNDVINKEVLLMLKHNSEANTRRPSLLIRPLIRPLVNTVWNCKEDIQYFGLFKIFFSLCIWRSFWQCLVGIKDFPYWDGFLIIDDIKQGIYYTICRVSSLMPTNNLGDLSKDFITMYVITQCGKLLIFKTFEISNKNAIK